MSIETENLLRELIFAWFALPSITQIVAATGLSRALVKAAMTKEFGLTSVGFGKGNSAKRLNAKYPVISHKPTT